MTRFEKDFNIVKQNPIKGIEILKYRKEELRKLNKEGRACKNSFRLDCILKNIAILNEEYQIISELI